MGSASAMKRIQLWWALWICVIRTESNLGNRNEADAGCIDAEAPASLGGLVLLLSSLWYNSQYEAVWKTDEGYTTGGITSQFLPQFFPESRYFLSRT